MATESSTATVLTADEPVMLALWCLGSLLVAATLVPASKYIQQDYHEFLSLGPGGTPSTIPGYLRIKALSCFALRDRYRPPPVPKHEQRPHGYLSSLPARNRPRPETRGIAPHRQVTQTVTADILPYLTVDQPKGQGNSLFFSDSSRSKPKAKRRHFHHSAVSHTFLAGWTARESSTYQPSPF
ncbi:unnamed protein product [Zymoseptoria tritici ST99CH_3D7]|uniref:Uncharacterized protein n=1 Tax=Zymoseptoria tritici (strain ST99CH_3D7) TaxID=1276538 RepID=A0A1X7RFV9_ZYMT9|nr:unnamed protein product [Zymoseptoria tritici ST99CH_3D7]